MLNTPAAFKFIKIIILFKNSNLSENVYILW